MIISFNDFNNTSFLGVSKSDVKMSSDTSYKQQFDQKKITKVKQFSFEDGTWVANFIDKIYYQLSSAIKTK